MNIRYIAILPLLISAADAFSDDAVPVQYQGNCQQENVIQNLAVKCQSNTLQITVRTNPTTGFDWHYKNYSQDLLKPADPQYRSVYDDPELGGAPSIGTYTSEVLKSGLVSFDFCYMQNWTGGDFARGYRFELTADESRNITGYRITVLNQSDIKPGE